MSFGDRPPYDDGATNVSADVLQKREQCHDAIFELDTMKALAKSLDALPGGAVRRILSWLADRYGYVLSTVDEADPLPLASTIPVRDTEPMPRPVDPGPFGLPMTAAYAAPIARNPVQVAPWLGSAVADGMPAWNGE